jgi:hypothetical protein
MAQIAQRISILTLLLVGACAAFGQSDYRVISVSNGGTISGTVKWAGPLPRNVDFPVTKDPQVCDPDSKKTTDLERLIVGPQGGVANTVVYLKNISRGKALELPEQRRHLDQKDCRYIPHILLVPENGVLSMQSSDATLHIVHMDGAATLNLPFPFPDRVSSRTLSNPGLVHVRCNGGHTWMSAELLVVRQPYYAVTSGSGEFELTDVPPGTYQIVAWHEGRSTGKQPSLDVSTGSNVDRPVFAEPKTWVQSVTVGNNEAVVVNFAIGDK